MHQGQRLPRDINHVPNVPQPEIRRIRAIHNGQNSFSLGGGLGRVRIRHGENVNAGSKILRVEAAKKRVASAVEEKSEDDPLDVSQQMSNRVTGYQLTHIHFLTQGWSDMDVKDKDASGEGDEGDGDVVAEVVAAAQPSQEANAEVVQEQEENAQAEEVHQEEDDAQAEVASTPKKKTPSKKRNTSSGKKTLEREVSE